MHDSNSQYNHIRYCSRKVVAILKCLEILVQTRTRLDSTGSEQCSSHLRCMYSCSGCRFGQSTGSTLVPFCAYTLEKKGWREAIFYLGRRSITH
eukprot:4135496-Pyramimonas_sp.AAC.1